MKKRGSLAKDKRGLELEILGWWIIGTVILIIIVAAIFLLSERGQSYIEYLKDLIRLR